MYRLAAAAGASPGWSRMTRVSPLDPGDAVSAARTDTDSPARPVDPGLGLVVDPQPDDETCGPACLHAIYRYYSDDVPLTTIAAELRTLDLPGTKVVVGDGPARAGARRVPRESRAAARLSGHAAHVQPRVVRSDLVRFADRRDPRAAQGPGGGEEGDAPAGRNERLRRVPAARRHARAPRPRAGAAAQIPEAWDPR